MVFSKLRQPLIYLTLLGSSFACGMFFQGKRHAEEHAADLAAREREIRAEFQRNLDLEQQARVALENDLAGLRRRENELLGQATDLEAEDACVANPFSPTFVELYNRAASLPATPATD